MHNEGILMVESVVMVYSVVLNTVTKQFVQLDTFLEMVEFRVWTIFDMFYGMKNLKRSVYCFIIK